MPKLHDEFNPDDESLDDDLDPSANQLNPDYTDTEPVPEELGGDPDAEELGSIDTDDGFGAFDDEAFDDEDDDEAFEDPIDEVDALSDDECEELRRRLEPEMHRQDDEIDLEAYIRET